jgi:hypothetical protein
LPRLVLLHLVIVMFLELTERTWSHGACCPYPTIRACATSIERAHLWCVTWRMVYNKLTVICIPHFFSGSAAERAAWEKERTSLRAERDRVAMVLIKDTIDTPARRALQAQQLRMWLFISSQSMVLCLLVFYHYAIC